MSCPRTGRIRFLLMRRRRWGNKWWLMMRRCIIVLLIAILCRGRRVMCRLWIVILKRWMGSERVRRIVSDLFLIRCRRIFLRNNRWLLRMYKGMDLIIIFICWTNWRTKIRLGKASIIILIFPMGINLTLLDRIVRLNFFFLFFKIFLQFFFFFKLLRKVIIIWIENIRSRACLKICPTTLSNWMVINNQKIWVQFNYFLLSFRQKLNSWLIFSQLYWCSFEKY